MSPKAILALAAALPALTLLAPTNAGAQGSYKVTACNAAPEAVNHSWVWSTNDPSIPPHYSEFVNCPERFGGDGGTTDQQGGLSTTDALGLSSGAPPGTSAGWSLTAPPGTTIGAIEYERYIGHKIDPDNDWSPALRADGQIVGGETCLDSPQNGETCFIGGPAEEGVADGIVSGLSAHELSLGILCQAPTGDECVTGATEHSAWAAMYGATVTIDDPTAPTLATPTGPLWESGYKSGKEAVTVEASDAGGGLQSINLSVEGDTLATYSATCNFTYLQPCPATSGAQTLTLPTEQLTDGTHTVMVTAIDAAGNETSVSEQISVANKPPPAPTGLSATATTAGGSTFTVSWEDPTVSVPIASATYQVCPASSTTGCSAAATAPPQGSATVMVPGTGSWRIGVWLTNAAGKSSQSNSAYVTVTVTAPPTEHYETGGTETGGTNPPTEQHEANPTPIEEHPSETHETNPTESKEQKKLKLTGSLHGRTLTVRVTGPASGQVRIAVRAKLRGKLVVIHRRTVALRDGELKTTFKLTTREAKRAVVLLSASTSGKVRRLVLHPHPQLLGIALERPLASGASRTQGP